MGNGGPRADVSQAALIEASWQVQLPIGCYIGIFDGYMIGIMEKQMRTTMFRVLSPLINSWIIFTVYIYI